MNLASLLNESNVFIGIDGSTREAIYTELLKKIATEHSLKLDINKVVKMMIDREETTKMPYENYLALPHARSKEFTDLYFAIAISKKPVKLKPYDKTESCIFLMSLISENSSELYLRILSALARYVSVETNVKKLCSAKTPSELISIIANDRVEIKHNLTAEDVMNKDIPCLSPQDKLSTAIDYFVREKLDSLPVIDQSGKLVGIITTKHIMRRAIPEHFFLMENVNFLTSFEPFEKVLKEEESISIKEIMFQPQDDTVDPNTPLVRITMKLVKECRTFVFVIDKNERYLGMIKMNDIIRKILRG